MLLLILFAFVAGAGTALSPCVLPVLPIVLSAGATGSRRRPLGVVTGLALSFTFATVALVYVIDALGLPAGLPRTLAIVVLLGFGLVLMLPPLAHRFETALSRLTGRLGGPRGGAGDGFASGLVLGGSLGFVYAPCAGPILAGVITVSASQSFSAGRLAVAFAYGAGSAVVLYVLALAGRRATSRLSAHAGRLQVAMGAVMVIVGVAMFARLDLRFENAVARSAPAFVVNPAHAVETSARTQRSLQDVRSGPQARSAAGSEQAATGQVLPVLGRAPEIVGTQRWFNTPGGRRLTLRGLRGRVVLVDFWTYSCINCIRTLPYLKAWDRRYRRDGLTIIGVHTPEFPFERSAANVEHAVRADGLRYPVAQDNDEATWNAYRNQYWPAEYLIDARGRLRLVEFGEGGYARKERAIRALLAEARHVRLGRETRTRATAAPTTQTTPESYLGAARAERFAGMRVTPGVHTYPAITPPADHLAFGGAWDVGADSATAGAGSTLALSFRARRVFLVLGSPGRARDVRVALDGRPVPAGLAGADVRGGRARVREQRLYRLVSLPRPGRHLLRLTFPAGVQGYAFTFG